MSQSFLNRRTVDTRQLDLLNSAGYAGPVAVVANFGFSEERGWPRPKSFLITNPDRRGVDH